MMFDGVIGHSLLGSGARSSHRYHHSSSCCICIDFLDGAETIPPIPNSGHALSFR
jgi:hypothetical protein